MSGRRLRQTTVVATLVMAWLRFAAAVVLAPLLAAGCAGPPALACVDTDEPTCGAAFTTAIASLQADLQTEVQGASVRPSSALSCTSAPGCRPVVDVELAVRGVSQPLVVTVSVLPDGRLVAETY